MYNKGILRTLSLAVIGLHLFSYPANADDDAIKGIIAGTVLMGLNELAAQNEQQQTQQEDITWNETAQNQVYSEQEIQRTGEIQRLLSSLEFYDGAIDGLEGRQTLDAIYRWEAEYDQTIDGRISDQELGYLQRLLDERISGTSVASNKQKVLVNDAKTELLTGFQSLAQMQNLNTVCTDFRSTGNVYSSAIHYDFAEKSAEFLQFMESISFKQAECLKLSGDEIEDLKVKGRAQYQATEEYQMYKMLVPVAIADDQAAMDIVKGCNAYIEFAQQARVKFKDQQVDEQTCLMRSIHDGRKAD